jgi:putative DNA primase/helicase
MGTTTATEFEAAHKLNAAKIQETEAEEQAAEEEGNVVHIPWPSQLGPEPDYSDETTQLPYGFRYGRYGSIERRIVKDGDEQWIFLCSPIEFLATTGSADDKSPGLLVNVRADSGRQHQLALPRSALIGGGEDLLRELVEHGLRFSPLNKDASELKRLLMSVAPRKRARCVPHIGWYERTFVLPDEVLGQPPDQQIVFQPPHVADHHYRIAGTFDGWKSEVAARALGNTRLEFAISVAFAGPLLNPAGLDGGGFHFRGPSSLGKSTALYASGSVWGGGGINGFTRSWRTTDNALEGMAVTHNDAFLPLDEINQVEPGAVSRAAYMLANGQGKSRANKNGALRSNHEWRVIFLSTGEISLSSKIAEDGKRSTAGQEVRVIDIPADAGQGFGLFEKLHGFSRPDLFADALRDATRRHYGHAASAFIAEIVKDVPGTTAQVKEAVASIASKICPEKADGQVRRVAHRFALVACAGELAIPVWYPALAHHNSIQGR